jgi:agmatinase
MATYLLNGYLFNMTKTSTKTPKKTTVSKTKSALKPTGNKAASQKKPKAKPIAKSAPVKPAQRKLSAEKVVEKNNQSSSTWPDFLGLPKKYSNKGNARVHIIPVPYEATTSYGKGTANGPRAIFDASQEVELFDDELWAEPFKIGIHSAEPIVMKKMEPAAQKPFQELYEQIKPLIETDRFPIVVGGEHSLTLGAIRACAERYKDLSVLQIDAHCDLRPAYEGNPYSHASVAFRIYETLAKPLITQVGIRNVSWEEVKWMEEEHPKVNIYWARNQDKWNFQEIINTLSNNVYLTIDVDGLDSGIMPATGTPEPGGMSWYQLMELIKLLCVKKNVVAADVVELSPIPGLHAPNFLAAKLIYKLIGYRYALDLGVTKRY